MKSILMRITQFSFLLFLFIPDFISAETKIFIEEYNYQASEYDSKVTCRALALEQVKRLLLEKLGIYLESETVVNNFQIAKDQIITLTAGIVGTDIIDEKWDGKTYYLKAKITADPKNVVTSIEKLYQNRQKTKELAETRKKADAALSEVQRLRKELEISKAGRAEQDQYTKAVNSLSAIDWFEKGYAFGIAERNQEAIMAFTKAIELDSNYWMAYILRGDTYAFLRSHHQAIKDYDKVIELQPAYSYAYISRGEAYTELGNNERAIKNYDKAIEVDPKSARAYAHRANVNETLGNKRQAIKDYDRAIKLEPKTASLYYLRAEAYLALGNKRQAIKDYDMVIKLDPKFKQAYVNRGVAYGVLGDSRKAFKDFDKAIKLDSKYAMAYFMRGCAYLNLGESRQAIEDIKVAAKLGYDPAHDYLRSRGIEW